MAVVRYVLVKLRPGVDLDAFERFEREVDYVKAAQNPSIISYRTHRITDLDMGIDGGPWDFMERIEVDAGPQLHQDISDDGHRVSSCDG